MTHHEALVALFDRLAADGTADRYESLHDDVARQVLEAMEVRPGHQLLDVGCGAGWVTRRLGKKAPGAQAVGIDASRAMISRADEVSDWTSRARFECMTIEDIDFPDGRFDHVFALDALEYVEDLAAAASSLARVTKEGGCLELIVHRHADAPQTEAWSEADGVPMHHLDAAGWAAALTAAGFTVQGTEALRDEREDATFEETPLVPDSETRDASLRGAGLLWLRATR
ncbi:MAG: class I SAM-dependent methyltransferase [Planctomycetota bacterium]|nr:class I SAM-dependent methyltransferase [Planctomycetota bacterium]MDG1982945.1 class I SAM-dependent methyltransferase [Planctomycetota bacterium]